MDFYLELQGKRIVDQFGNGINLDHFLRIPATTFVLSCVPVEMIGVTCG